jgi:hypothetical protein
MNDRTTEWLLQGDAWIQYRTRVELLGQAETDPQVSSAREAMLADAKVQSLLTDLMDWPGSILNSHKSASQSFHKLAFIADLGLTVRDSPVREIVKKVMAHQSQQGPFQLITNVPKHFGGSGQDEWAWALCDAPILVSALIKMGLDNEKRVQTAVKFLDELVRDNGWPCTVSPELGKFRGPGSKEDPCPFATLAMLKVLSRVPELRESKSSKIGVNTLLTLWDKSRERHPYMFFMGTDFRKLKAPLFWYDILHVLDILSQFTWVWNDKRFKDMLTVVETKADDNGWYVPESIWMAWKDWDFGQKKVLSRGLTFFVERILKETR